MSMQSNLVSRRKKGTRRIVGYFLALLLSVGAFFSGLQFGQGVSGNNQIAGLFSLFAADDATEAPTGKPNLDEFWEVWNLLEEKFVTGSSTYEISEEERIRGAIDGLVDAYGDPYTVYMTPEDSATFNQNISGNFSGVGMEVGLRERLITVIAPLPDTPAEKAGILAGDVIVRIDDVSTEGMTIDEAVSLIRGDKGTVVTLTLYREGEMEFLEIPVTRDTINIPTVKTEQIDGTYVIAIYTFNGVAEKQVWDAMQEFVASDATSLIIDVRGNPGGYLQGAVSIASHFLPTGKVVVQEQFGDTAKNDVFRSRGRQVQPFEPKNLVVLVDNGSASASEILAGALRDHGVATVIGTQTFGKGSVQELIELEDGSSLKVTVARWLTPNGTSISEGGLAPDIVINRTPEQRLAGEDPQLDAALRFLRGEEVSSETLENQLALDDEEVN